MNEVCSDCGRKHQRGDGYYLGSIYVNYGVTAVLVVSVFFACWQSELIPYNVLVWLLLALSLLFPLWFFRSARSLWTAVDEYFDPSGEG